MMTMAELKGYDLGRQRVAYDNRDVLLYNLAVGAIGEELDLVYERELRALPTFATALGLWASERTGVLGAYDNQRTLHVGQRLEMRGTLPAAADLEMTGRVAQVYDKGGPALIEVAVESEVFVATYVLFAPGAGGFGGERGPSSSASEPEGEPALRGTVVTDRRQALWYRLTGDRHPMHVDPILAASAGYPRPILHGLCTLGAVALEIARLAGEHPADLASVDVRFSSPVLPGDTLTVEAWSRPTRAVKARVGEATALSGTMDWR